MSSQTKRTLLSLTGLGIFLLLAFGSEYSTNKNSSTNNRSVNIDVNKNTTTYVNSKSSFTGTLEENYVDFSFEYPKSWKRDPDAGKGASPNFVQVGNETPGHVTIENFAVGYCSGPLSAMPQLATKLNDQFANTASFPEYKKVSEGATTVAGIDGYEFHFTGHGSSAGKDLDFWGRVVLLPSTTSRKGAVLIMLTSSAGPILHGVDDVGEKGELPIILNSFKFGS